MNPKIPGANADGVKKSYGFCITRDGFIDRFLDIFLASHPDVKKILSQQLGGREAQKQMLQKAVNMALMYNEGLPVGQMSINKAANSHLREMGLAPELLSYWVESLISAVREFDPKADQTLLAAWRESLRPAMERLANRQN